MRKLVYTMLVSLLWITVSLAQSRSVSGVVLDASGQPVDGASILIKGTKTGASADAKGNFKINAKTGDILVISAVNFTTVEYKVGTESDVRIIVQNESSQIEEVIVTAQGVKKKPREIGYAYAKISNEDVTVGRPVTLAQGLAGKVSGLAIYNVNNSVDPQVKVVLRGYRSLTGNNEALVVLDGIQTTQTVLPLINPNDIESITILKSSQAAILYGAEGVNGAIVINTKKGAKGKSKVSYSTSANFEQISFLPDFQDQYGSGSHYSPSYTSIPDYKERMRLNWRPFENQQYGDPFNGEDRIIGRVTEDGSKLIRPYSAIKGIRRKTFDIGSTWNNTVNFSGGDDKGTFYLSAENNQTKGIVPGDKSTRTGIRLSSTRNMNKLTTSFNAAYVQAAYDRANSDFYYDVMNQAAHIPITEMRNWRTDKFANPNGYYNDYYNNPYFNKDINRQRYSDYNIQGNLELNYKANSWLSFTERVGITNNTRQRKNTVEKFLYSDWAKNSANVPAPWDWANDYDGIDRAGTDILGSVYDAATTENVVNNEFMAMIEKQTGDINNKILIGQSLYQRKTKFVEIGSSSIVVPGVYNVANRQGELSGSESNTTRRKWGYYIDYTGSWKDMIYLNASFRYDGTSVFYKDGRATNLYQFPYYGATLSAVLTDLFPSIKSNTLSFAKVRVGYNANGADGVAPYNLDPIYPVGSNYPYGSNVGYTVGGTLPDGGLKPELVTSFEVGGEFQFMKGRISIDLSSYWSTTKDGLLTVRIPNTTGFQNLLLNVGESKNWGYEADLKTQIVRSKNWNIDFNVRYSYNDNKVVSLYAGVDQFAYGGYAYASTYVIKDKRYPFLKTTDYVRDAATGLRVVNKTTGYPLLATSALVDQGGTLPRHMIGAGSKVTYGDFSLNFNFEFRGGNKIFSQIGRDMTFTGSGAWTSERTPHIMANSGYDDGTGKIVPNTTVYIAESEYSFWVDYYRNIASNYVTPGWFIKLRDLNLSYTIPKNLVGKTRVFSEANIGLYGRNLFTIVDKANFYTDPEFSFTTGNGLGINNSLQTPPVRQFGVNLNLTF